MRKCQVEIFDEQSRDIDLSLLEQLVQAIWSEEGELEAHLRIILADDDKLVTLNQEFLGRDCLTDVIAFPISDNSESVFEGEIYISVQRVFENASIFSVTAEDELLRIVTHGVLHFLGYSDSEEAEKKAMSERESHYLALFRAGENNSGREL